MKTAYFQDIEPPQEVTVQAGREIKVKGPKGEVVKTFVALGITISAEQNKLKIGAAKATKREKRLINTLAAHVRNMIEGVQRPYIYRLKICSGHFPMTASIAGDKFIVKNFLGEKKPRTLTLKNGISVKIEGANITIESCDIELAGQTAGHIELLMRVGRGHDRRTFQDGVYITEKPERVLK